MPLTPHMEKHFTATATVRDIVIGMSDGLTVPFALAAGLSGAVESSGIIMTAGLAVWWTPYGYAEADRISAEQKERSAFDLIQPGRFQRSVQRGRREGERRQAHGRQQRAIRGQERRHRHDAEKLECWIERYPEPTEHRHEHELERHYRRARPQQPYASTLRLRSDRRCAPPSSPRPAPRGSGRGSR